MLVMSLIFRSLGMLCCFARYLDCRTQLLIDLLVIVIGVPMNDDDNVSPLATSTFSVADFNHCSTLCNHENGILVAWYGGTDECSDDQSIFVLCISNNRVSEIMNFGEKVGNPVLWNENGKAYLLWSEFEDNDKIKRPADRWKYCKLWMAEISFQNGMIDITRQTKFDLNLLGRCNPIRFKNNTYLPLYDEINRNGVILVGSDLKFSRCGDIGENMIQPTIWAEDDILYTLSRTFHSPESTSQRCYSTDGIVWSDPELTTIQNLNSSLHSLLWNGYVLLIWNDTFGTARRNLTLGIVEGLNVRKLFVIDSHGAYPSLCEDNDGNVCASYTTINRRIKFVVWPKQELLSRCGRN